MGDASGGIPYPLKGEVAQPPRRPSRSSRSHRPVAAGAVVPVLSLARHRCRAEARSGQRQMPASALDAGAIPANRIRHGPRGTIVEPMRTALAAVDVHPGARSLHGEQSPSFITTPVQRLHNLSPAGATDRSALPISADGVSAKGAVSDFVDPIGYDVVDTGRLADSGRPQPGTPSPASGWFESLAGHRSRCCKAPAHREAAPR